MKGIVKWFNQQKGFGFITDEDGNDHFVHFSGISEGRTYKTIETNDEVEFNVVEGEKGSQAMDVKVTRFAPKEGGSPAE